MHPRVHCTRILFLSAENNDILYHRPPLGCRGSACVEVMTTLHGSAPSLRKRVGGCIPLEGTISSSRDPI